MTLAIGVDGGGTRTRAVVVDERGTEVARAEFAGAVATAIAPELAAEAVAGAVRAAVDRAGFELPAVVLWAGLAGAGADLAAGAVHDRLAGMGLAQDIVVGTDVEAAFHDAFGDGPGVLLIAGTGSIAWVRNASGRRRQIGGWGQQLGDEGSGYAIGLSGLRYLTQAHDGRARTSGMLEPLLSACGVETPVDLIAWTGAATKSEMAALAPVVIACADAGDAAAVAIVNAAVGELMTHVDVAIAEAGASEPARVVLWGGLLAESGPLGPRVREALDAREVDVISRRLDPPMGAARMALRRLSETRPSK